MKTDEGKQVERTYERKSGGYIDEDGFYVRWDYNDPDDNYGM